MNCKFEPLQLVYLANLVAWCFNAITDVISLSDFSTWSDIRSLQSLEEVPLSAADFENGRKLKYDDLYASNFNKRRLDERIKGDYSGKAAWTLSRPKNGKKIRRNGVKQIRDKWPNGVIPYTLSPQFSTRERALIARGIDEYHKRTCVRFQPRNVFQRDYVHITKIDGCFSDVGRAGGRQEVSLDDGCVEYDTIIHELMHVVGFYHEHERYDRGTFVDIIWYNIDRQAFDQFGTVNLLESDYYNTQYDYFSIMHYDRKSFSRNGGDTMRAKTPGMTEVIGTVKDFSSTDLTKINRMYNCAQQPTPGVVTPWAPWQPVQPPTTNWQPWQPVTVWTSWQPVTQAPQVWNPWQPVQPTSQNCRDVASICYLWLGRCRSSFFESIMRQFCALSCGFCRPRSTSPGRRKRIALL